MPAPAEWASAITDAGFDAQFDPEFDVDSFTGFLPCAYKGEPAGFEYYAEALNADGRAALQLPDHVDFAVTFVTGANMREFITSLIASGVLCRLSNGTFFDPQSGEFTPADSVLEMIRSDVAECEKDL